MIIDIIDATPYLNHDQRNQIMELIQSTSEKLQLNEDSEVDISIVNNEVIHQLNLFYRNIDRPTDVLSFALEEDIEGAPIIRTFDSGNYSFPIHLGDIIISYPKAVEQAEEYGHSIARELGFLAVHGFLHLNGFDHQTEEDEKLMFQIQNEVLKDNGLER